MMWSGDWSGWDFLWMSLMMIVFWGGLLWLIVYVVRQFSAPKETSGTRSAVEVLEERFARGEIDEDEYQDRRRILGRERPDPKISTRSVPGSDPAEGWMATPSSSPDDARSVRLH